MKHTASWLHALRNADLAWVGQWPWGLRLAAMVLVCGACVYAWWALQLQAALEQLAVQEARAAQLSRTNDTPHQLGMSPLPAFPQGGAHSALGQLQASARAHQIRIIRIKQSPQSAGNPALSTPATSVPPPASNPAPLASASPKAQAPMWTVTVGADYAHWRSWLHTLATGPWLWHLRRFEIETSPVPRQFGNLLIHMTLSEHGPRLYALSAPALSLMAPAAINDGASAAAGTMSKDTKVVSARDTASQRIAALFDPAPLQSSTHVAGLHAGRPSSTPTTAQDEMELVGTVMRAQSALAEATAQQPLDDAGAVRNLISGGEYQAVIRQGGRLHMLLLGQKITDSQTLKQWRLEEIQARSALLREEKTGEQRALTLPPPSQGSRL